MMLHVLAEFGPALNLQHRITYLYHKPAYNINRRLFTINEITHGIIKWPLSLPSHLSCAASSPTHAPPLPSVNPNTPTAPQPSPHSSAVTSGGAVAFYPATMHHMISSDSELSCVHVTTSTASTTLAKTPPMSSSLDVKNKPTNTTTFKYHFSPSSLFSNRPVATKKPSVAIPVSSGDKSPTFFGNASAARSQPASVTTSHLIGAESHAHTAEASSSSVRAQIMMLDHHATESTCEYVSPSGSIRIPLKFSSIDPRLKFRVSRGYPFVSFLLSEGTESGTRFSVLYPKRLWKIMRREAVINVERHVRVERVDGNRFLVKLRAAFIWFVVDFCLDVEGRHPYNAINSIFDFSSSTQLNF